ncbi:hypothetical protein DM40_233 [Burkholderia cenocepacia]|nr:hypothetical protein DM40_233 [Burkholderia cenocepacia]
MRACWPDERVKQVTHISRGEARAKKRRRCPSGTPAFSLLPLDVQGRRNKLAPYTSADNAVIQKLVGQSV